MEPRPSPAGAPRPQAAGPGPDPPPRDAISAVQGRVLDPATALIVDGVMPAADGLRRPAAHGLEVGRRGRRAGGAARRSPSARLDRGARAGGPAHARLKLGAAHRDDRVASDRAAIAPDGWTLLQQTRAQFGVDARAGRRARPRRVRTRADSSRTRSTSRTPSTSPTRSTSAHPAAAAHVGARSPPTRLPGSGGRQPVAYVGPPPRCGTTKVTGRRPVVAMLDTGCGKHPWLDGVVEKGVDARRHARSATTTPSTEPELHGDLAGQLDGIDRPAVGPRHLHRGPRPPGVPRRRHPGLAGRAVRRARSSSPTWSPPWPRSPSSARRYRAGEAGGHADRRAQPVDRATTTRRRRTSCSTRRCTPSSRTCRRHGTWWSARPATTRPAGRASRRRSAAGPTATARSAATRPSCRSSRSGRSTPTAHRRAVQQRRAWVRAFAHGRRGR